MNEKLQARIENEKKMSINDFLNEREIKLSNRVTIQQNPHFNFLKVLQLGHERIQMPDQKQKLEQVHKWIADFQAKEAMERQAMQSNKFLVGSNIDVFKHSHRLADINMNKGLKKRSLLEEITKMGGSGKYLRQRRCIHIMLTFGVQATAKSIRAAMRDQSSWSQPRRTQATSA